jgi:hypothetical protein
LVFPVGPRCPVPEDVELEPRLEPELLPEPPTPLCPRWLVLPVGPRWPVPPDVLDEPL